jgi:hypothetical protein
LKGFRRDLALEDAGQLFALLDVPLNLVPVVMIVGQGRIDVHKGELWVT